MNLKLNFENDILIFFKDIRDIIQFSEEAAKPGVAY